MASKGRAIAVPPGAVSAPLPEVLSPQLATLVSAPPKTGTWDYEIKLDGYRMLARVDGDDVRLVTRNANDWTRKLTPIAESIKKLKLKSAWIDGEIVIADGDRSNFQALQNAFDASRLQDVQFYVFDLPYCNGFDLRHLELRVRRRFLETVMSNKTSDRIKFSETFGTDAKVLLEAACRMNLEGIIGKRVDSVYTSRRSPNWIKLKCIKEQEFVVVGFTEPDGSRTGFGSLMLALNEADGLHYAGGVGTGFDERTLNTLSAQLRALQQPHSSLAEIPRGLKGYWVKPTLVAQVSFSEWTDEGRIRHPVFKGLRTDKPPSSVIREIPLDRATLGTPPVSNRWRKSKR